MSHTDGLVSPYGSSKSNRQSSSSTPVKRDDLYYWETAVFKVEDTLFRVPRRCFNDWRSPFPAIFKNIDSSGVSSDESPIEITDASIDDFRVLLRVMYPCKARPVKTDEFVRAMYLSCRWGLIGVRMDIFDQLSPNISKVPIFERIAMSRVCKIRLWLVDAYASLVSAPPPIDLTSLAELGIEATIIAKLSHLRERRLLRVGTADDHPGEFCGCNKCIPKFAVARKKSAMSDVNSTLGWEIAQIFFKNDGSFFDASLMQRLNEARSSFVQRNHNRAQPFGPDPLYSRLLA